MSRDLREISAFNIDILLVRCGKQGKFVWIYSIRQYKIPSVNLTTYSIISVKKLCEIMVSDSFFFSRIL